MRALLFAVILLATSSATAEPVPVIEAGREDEIRALVLPYRTGTVVRDGFELESISVQRTFIRLLLRGPGDSEAALRLEHPSATAALAEGATSPDGARLATRSASFALLVEESPAAAAAALNALIDAVAANDPGHFWRVERLAVAPPPPTTPLLHSLRRLAVGTKAWLLDGLSLALVALLFLGWYLRRTFRDIARPLRHAFALAGIVALGILLRLLLSEDTTLTAWPYSRVVPLAREIYDRPLLAHLLGLFSGRVFLIELNSWTNFGLAAITPLVVFAAARPLIGTRPALLAALIMAILPMHIRFSRSDVYSIQSIVFTALTLALSHAALTAERRFTCAALLVLLTRTAFETYTLRPLNLLLAPLFVAAVILLLRGSADKQPPASQRTARAWRGALVACLLTAVAGLALREFVSLHSDQVGEGLGLETLYNAALTVFNLDYNTLLNPHMTPPLLAPLALLGAYSLWRQARGPRLVLFLWVWLGLFFATHAYVLPFNPLMQARYHLHLLLPFALLSAAGLDALWRWRTLAGAAAVVVLLASPLIHAEFARAAPLDMQNEFAFVRALRAHIPEGCTVLEYGGEFHENDFSRLARGGTYLDGSGEKSQNLWDVIIAGGGPEVHDSRISAADTVRRTLDRVLAAPPDCLFLYEGLRCWSEKHHDQIWAEACKTFRAELELAPVAHKRFAPRVYDANFAAGFGPDLRNPPFSEIELSLQRVQGRRATPREGRELAPASARPAPSSFGR